MNARVGKDELVQELKKEDSVRLLNATIMWKNCGTYPME